MTSIRQRIYKDPVLNGFSNPRSNEYLIPRDILAQEELLARGLDRNVIGNSEKGQSYDHGFVDGFTYGYREVYRKPQLGGQPLYKEPYQLYDLDYEELAMQVVRELIDRDYIVYDQRDTERGHGFEDGFVDGFVHGWDEVVHKPRDSSLPDPFESPRPNNSRNTNQARRSPSRNNGDGYDYGDYSDEDDSWGEHDDNELRGWAYRRLNHRGCTTCDSPSSGSDRGYEGTGFMGRYEDRYSAELQRRDDFEGRGRDRFDRGERERSGYPSSREDRDNYRMGRGERKRGRSRSPGGDRDSYRMRSPLNRRSRDRSQSPRHWEEGYYQGTPPELARIRRSEEEYDWNEPRSRSGSARIQREEYRQRSPSNRRNPDGRRENELMRRSHSPSRRDRRREFSAYRNRSPQPRGRDNPSNFQSRPGYSHLPHLRSDGPGDASPTQSEKNTKYEYNDWMVRRKRFDFISRDDRGFSPFRSDIDHFPNRSELRARDSYNDFMFNRGRHEFLAQDDRYPESRGCGSSYHFKRADQHLSRGRVLLEEEVRMRFSDNVPPRLMDRTSRALEGPSRERSLGSANRSSDSPSTMRHLSVPENHRHSHLRDILGDRENEEDFDRSYAGNEDGWGYGDCDNSDWSDY